ncbi:MAG: EVE domain-containing protein [Phycisphaeraceae bacterium]|nr:EVE domain-containing protein [Phycisphaeraceae bacterium]
MPTFLFKTEPDEFSYEDLARVTRSPWNGVANPGALAHLRTVRQGDDVLIYHTGKEKAVVGLARAVSAPYEDPERPGVNDAGLPRWAVVDLAPVAKAKKPVPLAQIKADARFAAFPLVTQGRLSVMPVPAVLDKALRALAGL